MGASVGRTVGWSVGWTVSRSDGRTDGRTDGRSVGRSIGLTDGRPAASAPSPFRALEHRLIGTHRAPAESALATSTATCVCVSADSGWQASGWAGGWVGRAGRVPGPILGQGGVGGGGGGGEELEPPESNSTRAFTRSSADIAELVLRPSEAVPRPSSACTDIISCP